MKSTLKRSCQMLAMIVISPLLLTHFLFGRRSSSDGSLESHSQALSLVPGMVGSYLRVAFYRVTIKHCHPDTTICFGVILSKTEAEIHRNAYIGPRCMVGLATICEDVLLGPAVQVPSGPQTHGIESLEIPIRLQPGNQRRVTIGRDSWIGAGAIVLDDVGEQSVIGAGSIVTKPIPPRVIAVGSPARSINERT